MRVNLNIPDELVERLDAYAKENYSSRSSIMCQACSQYLSAKEVQKLFSLMTKILKRIDETETIDEETKKQLDQFEMLSRLLSNQMDNSMS